MAEAGTAGGSRYRALFFNIKSKDFTSRPLTVYYYNIKKLSLAMDDDDDDAPPMLVAADTSGDPAEARESAKADDMKITKVPITIITGG